MTSKYLDPWGWFARNEKHPTRAIRHNNPLAHLHQEMDRMFDDVFVNLGMDPDKMKLPYSEMSIFPKLDVSETNAAYHISAELPGVDENDIKAELEEGVLTISGEKKAEEETKEKQFHRIERSYGAFRRAIPLPTDADSASVKAKFSKGILTIDIKKKAEEKTNTSKIHIETD